MSSSLDHINWGTVFAALTSLAALIISYKVYRRDQEIQRTAQARLITGWWTRVRKGSGEDLHLGNITGPDWPQEAGYRVWVSNSSNDAVYDCSVFASIKPSSILLEQLSTQNFVARPYMILFKNELIIPVGTVPPMQKMPHFIDPALVSSIDKLRIEFTDSNGVNWRRIAGKLSARPAAPSRPSSDVSQLLGPPDPPQLPD